MRILFIGRAPRNRTARATEQLVRLADAEFHAAQHRRHLAKTAARDQRAYDKRAARTAAWEAKHGKRSA
jgi:hypothetical protein